MFIYIQLAFQNAMFAMYFSSLKYFLSLLRGTFLQDCLLYVVPIPSLPWVLLCFEKRKRHHQHGPHAAKQASNWLKQMSVTMVDEEDGHRC